jgi:hypothetical protein
MDRAAALLLATKPHRGWYLLEFFCRTALPEVFDSTINVNPAMFRLLKNRSGGGGIFRVCQRADCNADHRWQNVGLPIDRRTAVWTKVAVDLSAACSIAGELFRSSRNGDSVDRIKGAYAKRCAGPALAFKTMTGGDQSRWFGKRQRESAATASGISHLENPPFSKKQDRVEISNRDATPRRDRL